MPLTETAQRTLTRLIWCDHAHQSFWIIFYTMYKPAQYQPFIQILFGMMTVNIFNIKILSNKIKIMVYGHRWYIYTKTKRINAPMQSSNSRNLQHMHYRWRHFCCGYTCLALWLLLYVVSIYCVPKINIHIIFTSHNSHWSLINAHARKFLLLCETQKTPINYTQIYYTYVIKFRKIINRPRRHQKSKSALYYNAVCIWSLMVSIYVSCAFCCSNFTWDIYIRNHETTTFRNILWTPN